MRRTLPLLLLVAALAPFSAHAQTSIDLSTLPAEIKTLKWQAVNYSSLAPIDRCRALLLLNDVLEEMGARSTAEADLMSQYIDTNNLGPQFAGQAPVADPAPLTMANAQQIAAALLQGPMAQSSYATQLSDTPADVLTAYESMYQSTCQRKWGIAADNRVRVRAMSRFLTAQKKMADFQAWVPGEIQRRAQQHEAELAQRRAAAATEQEKKQIEQLQLQEQRLQQEQQQPAAMKMQQALSVAQQSQNPTAPAQPQGAVVNDAYPDWYYGGAVALGAGAWYRDGAYRGAAAARTDARYGGWHGGRRR